MKAQRRCFVAILLLLFGPLSINGQELIHSGLHLSLGARGGVAMMPVRGDFSHSDNPGLGIGLDMSLGYYFTPGFGLRTGINRTSVITSMSGKDVVSEVVAPSPIYTYFEDCFTAVTPQVDESYSLAFLEIPVFLAFRGDHWYANGGVKALIPTRMDCHYNYAESAIEYTHSESSGNKIFFPPTPDPYPEQEGYVLLYSSKDDVERLFPFLLTLSVEGGYRVGCECGHSWILGAYVDWAVNSIHSNVQKDLLNVSDDILNADNPTQAAANSSTCPPGITHQESVLLSTAVKSMHFINLGFKLQYDFGLTR